MEIIAILAAAATALIVQIGKRTGVHPHILVAGLALIIAAIWELYVPGPLQAEIIARFAIIAATATGIYEFVKPLFTNTKAETDEDL